MTIAMTMATTNTISLPPPLAQPLLYNEPAPGISYFTPAQRPASGTAKTPQPNGQSVPKLFRPLTLRSVTFQNRIFLSPLCQYSAIDGHLTDWHMAHLGGIVSRGPGLTMIEATAVLPEGRITPEDSGLWSDSQIGPLRRITEFARGQGQRVAIQLAHAGRKASTLAPWLSPGQTATEEAGGWPDLVVAPSAVPFSDTFPRPREMTLADIAEVTEAFVAAARRAVAAGVDVIEIHNAHGYLLHEFLSPVSNKRHDAYGGSWENRVRLTLEVVEAVRDAIPVGMPLFLRISATDWLETLSSEQEFAQSWTLADTVRLAPLLAARGVDLLDVSSGGLHPKQKIRGGPAYQAPFANAVKERLGGTSTMAVSTVGAITNGPQANKLLEEEEGDLDVVFIGRMFQKNPGLVWTFAEELGTEIELANQIKWGFAGRGSGSGSAVVAAAGSAGSRKKPQPHAQKM